MPIEIEPLPVPNKKVLLNTNENDSVTGIEPTTGMASESERSDVISEKNPFEPCVEMIVQSEERDMVHESTPFEVLIRLQRLLRMRRQIKCLRSQVVKKTEPFRLCVK